MIEIDIDEIEQLMESNQTVLGSEEKKRIVTNHSVYGYEGSENYEHDDTGSIMNYSGCMDDILNAFAEHRDWQEDYDY